MERPRIRVLVADDHALVREGIRALLTSQEDIHVVGEAQNGVEAVSKAKELAPDVVLMDVTMPHMDGIEATAKIREAGLGCRVLGLTMHDSQAFFFLMLGAGACGYVLKGGNSSELVQAVRTVHQGDVYLTPAMASKLVASYLGQRKANPAAVGAGLTAREEGVLALVSQGKTNQAIADALGISVFTVQTHRAHTMKKLNLHSRADLLQYALSRGYITGPVASSGAVASLVS